MQASISRVFVTQTSSWDLQNISAQPDASVAQVADELRILLDGSELINPRKGGGGAEFPLTIPQVRNMSSPKHQLAMHGIHPPLLASA